MKYSSNQDGITVLITLIVTAIVIFIVLGALWALIVMLLWNALVPDIFHLQEINFWQAWGLYILSSFLFKNFNPEINRKN